MHASCYKSGFLAKFIGGECSKEDVVVTNFTSLYSAKPDSISFYSDPRYKDHLLKTSAAIVILKRSDSFLRDAPSIYVDDPYLAFAKISSLFFKSSIKSEVHKTAYVEKSSKIDRSCYIGPSSSIGANCLIGKYVQIGSNVSIGDNVVIGSNVIIRSNVTLESNTQIGDNCQISSGVRIGNDGFGFAKDVDGSWFKIPHTGKVIIGKDVDIGSNTTIDRGAIENTIIEDGVKIDNLVQIAHNCFIGENTIIAGCVGIAGSAKIGKNCMIGGASMIKGHLEIADGTIISGGTGIGKSIKIKGKRFTNVFPYNIEHKDWLRIASKLKNLGNKNE